MTETFYGPVVKIVVQNDTNLVLVSKGLVYFSQIAKASLSWTKMRPF